jgi:hypothetical protein
VSGHGAGAETPRAESLVVHYDTTVDSVVSGTSVVDISGNGINGTLTGGAAYSSTDRALTFDGVDDTITATYPSSAGDNTFSASFWVKRNANAATYCPFYLGDAGNGEGIGMDIYTNGSVYWFIYGGKNFLWTGVTGTWFPVGSWTHVAVSHTAGTDFANLNKVWINGVDVSAGKTLNSGTLDLTLDVNDTLTLGARVNLNYLNGSISNFKLWGGVALTAEEVAQEYALGRTGKSLNLTDTALCLGGTVPRAQLDVRGGAFINGIVGTGPTDGIIIPSGTTVQQPTGQTGMVRFNTTINKLQVHNGTIWLTVGGVNATGGTVTYADGYTIHTFTNSGDFTVYSGGDIELLVVGGGGAGGGGRHAGGGGAGAVIHATNVLLNNGAYVVTIGAGGAGASGNIVPGNPSPSTITKDSLTLYSAQGGGYGGIHPSSSIGTMHEYGKDGGCGGGAGHSTTQTTTGFARLGLGLTATPAFGGNGAPGLNRSATGGGGGAGGNGTTGTGAETAQSGTGGNGGDGYQTSINGTPLYWAGGGGGSASPDTYSGSTSAQWVGGNGGKGGGGGGATGVISSASGSSGGSGGGSALNTGSNGAKTITSGVCNGGNAGANTGGGGGGAGGWGTAGNGSGGNGGSGIVIIRYLS